MTDRAHGGADGCGGVVLGCDWCAEEGLRLVQGARGPCGTLVSDESVCVRSDHFAVGPVHMLLVLQVVLEVVRLQRLAER